MFSKKVQFKSELKAIKFLFSISFVMIKYHINYIIFNHDVLYNKNLQ